MSIAFNSNGQVCASYVRTGLAYNTGGKHPFKIDILLVKNNHKFVFKTTSWANDGKELFMFAADSSIGIWTFRRDTLFLDFSPGHPDREFSVDRYLVKRRKLIRISSIDHVKYKAAKGMIDCLQD
jgi:hypothetical protein